MISNKVLCLVTCLTYFNFLRAREFPIITGRIDSFPNLILDSVFIKSNPKYDIFLSPLSDIALFNPIDGFLIQSKAGVRIKRERPLVFVFKPRYSINRQSIYAEAELSGILGKYPKNKTSYLFSGGTFLYQVNEPFKKNEQIISLSNIIEEINPLLYIQKKYGNIQLNHDFPYLLRLSGSLEYAHRFYQEIYAFKNFRFSPNLPPSGFNKLDKAFISTFDVSYSSHLILSYKKGIKGWAGSHSDFDFIQLIVSGTIPLSMKNRLDLSVITGRFLRRNFIHFNDYYHFPTGRTLKSSNPVVTGFRLLDYYGFSTNHYFFRFHVQSQSENFFLNKLSFIKKGKILENVFLNVALTEKVTPYFEIGYALDHVFNFCRLEVAIGRVGDEWLGPRIILGPIAR
jgi:hypothetical protein